MGKWLKILSLPAILAALAAPPAGAAELVTTHPSHYARPGEALQGAGQGAGGRLVDRTKQARAGSHVIVRDPAALQEGWIVSAELSRACSNRLFRQKRDRFLVGVVDGRAYGAAVGGHASLLDRAKLAESNAIYLFRDQGTTDCRVYQRAG